MEKCPACGWSPIKCCQCPKKDSECTHGHQWHYDAGNGEMKRGNSHSANLPSSKKGTFIIALGLSVAVALGWFFLHQKHSPPPPR